MLYREEIADRAASTRTPNVAKGVCPHEYDWDCTAENTRGLAASTP